MPEQAMQGDMKRFYKRFQTEHLAFLQTVDGLSAGANCVTSVSLTFTRLMFLYFLQKKGLLGGNAHDLCKHLPTMEKDREGTLQINAMAFERLLTFFESYIWLPEERSEHSHDEITPDMLGLIFEQQINARQKGTHYTTEDVSDYIAKNSIIPFLFDAVEQRYPAAFQKGGPVWRLLQENPDRYIYDVVQCEGYLPLETEEEYLARRRRCAELRAKLASGEIASINDLITYNLDIGLYAQDVIKCSELHLLYALYEQIERITILDPCCGSGAFLLAALKVLEPLYTACFERIGDLPKSSYEIRKTIITNNLYGLDMQEEASEICKLRLLLKLAATGQEIEEVDLLLGLTRNIRTGNMLVGKTTYDGENQLEASEAWLARDRAMACEYGIDPANKLAFEQWRSSHQPFHWLVEFDEVMKRGGFDVIISNPPYVEYAEVKTEYSLPPDGYKTAACGNLYAYCIERSIQLLGKRGRWGMIVPLSGFATSRMQPLQKLVAECSTSFYACFLSGDANPSRLFEGVKFRLCIGLACKGEASACTYYSTKYNRWYAQERKRLFRSLHYCESTDALRDGSMPKFGQNIEPAIMQKIAGKPSLRDFMDKGETALYYHTCPVNWIRATTFIPNFHSDRDGEKTSSQLHSLNFSTEELRDAAICIINSSLFFWFWLVYSDCYHLTTREIGGFPIDLKRLVAEQGRVLSEISHRLMQDYRAKSRQRIYCYKKTGTVIYDEFYPKRSKPIIDEIDRLLAQHYGFSDDELNFILNYEIKYRSGLQHRVSY